MAVARQGPRLLETDGRRFLFQVEAWDAREEDRGRAPRAVSSSRISRKFLDRAPEEKARPDGRSSSTRRSSVREFAPFVVTIERGKIKEFRPRPSAMRTRCTSTTRRRPGLRVGRQSSRPPTFMTTFREGRAATMPTSWRELGDGHLAPSARRTGVRAAPSRSSPATRSSAARASWTSTEKTGPQRPHGHGRAGRKTVASDKDRRRSSAPMRHITVVAAMKFARVYADDVKVGDELPPLVKGPRPAESKLTRYAGPPPAISNPIHQDHEFAKGGRHGRRVRPRACCRWAFRRPVRDRLGPAPAPRPQSSACASRRSCA